MGAFPVIGITPDLDLPRGLPERCADGLAAAPALASAAQDRGKNFVAGSDRAKGKPTGAGIIFVLVFLFCLALVLPASWKLWCIAACLAVSMLTGYFDDASRGSWGNARRVSGMPASAWRWC